MVLPRLIHPVPVTIEPINRPDTVFDDNLREPIGQVARASTITLDAQIKNIDDDDPRPSPEGIIETTRGYMLFRQIDLDGVGYTPTRGDRVITLGNRTGLDLYVTKFQHRGHYPDQGGHSLVKVWFADRHPTRQRGAL